MAKTRTTAAISMVIMATAFTADGTERSDDYNVYFSYRLKFTAEESLAMRAFIAAAQSSAQDLSNVRER